MRLLPGLVLALALAACSEETILLEPTDLLVEPFKGVEEAPQSFKARFETTGGDFVVVVNREWAPVGADRFWNLIRRGYYQDVAFHRVVPFAAQFGFHPEPRVSRAWARAYIEGEPPRQSNLRGFLTFAQTSQGPDTRSMELFVNKVDNTHLDRMGFAPIGRVVEGMEVVDALHGTGDGAPAGPGPAPQRILYEGLEFLKKEYPDLDYIKTVTILE